MPPQREPARWGDVPFLVLCCGLAFALKLHYGTASPSDLKWILAPTTQGVAWLTGESFVFEPNNGYVSSHLAFVIAPACAGVNFAIAACLTGWLGFFRQFRTALGRVGLLLATAAIAFVATLAANTFRIGLAIELHAHPSWLEPAGVSAAAAHRLLGVVVYSGCLSGMFLFASDMVSRARHAV